MLAYAYRSKSETHTKCPEKAKRTDQEITATTIERAGERSRTRGIAQGQSETIETGTERGEGLEAAVWIEIRTGTEKGIEIPDVDIASKLLGPADNMCWKVDGCTVGSSESRSPSRHRRAKNRDEDRHHKPRSSRRRSRSGSRSDSSDYSSDSESEDERRRRKRKERERKREKEDKEVRTTAQMFGVFF